MYECVYLLVFVPGISSTSTGHSKVSGSLRAVAECADALGLLLVFECEMFPMGLYV